MAPAAFFAFTSAFFSISRRMASRLTAGSGHQRRHAGQRFCVRVGAFVEQEPQDGNGVSHRGGLIDGSAAINRFRVDIRSVLEQQAYFGFVVKGPEQAAWISACCRRSRRRLYREASFIVASSEARSMVKRRSAGASCALTSAGFAAISFSTALVSRTGWRRSARPASDRQALRAGPPRP